MNEIDIRNKKGFDAMMHSLNPIPKWTREQAIQSLIEVVVDQRGTRDAVAAIKELNSLHGYNAPVSIDLAVDGRITQVITKAVLPIHHESD